MLLHSAALPRRVLTPIHTVSASRCVIACPDAATRPLASLDALTLSSSSAISAAPPSTSSTVGALTASASAIGAVDCASCIACDAFACADGYSSAAPRGFHGTARGAAGLAASVGRGFGGGPGGGGGGGGASQLRASHVASAASKELLRLSPSWASVHCSTPFLRALLLRPSRPHPLGIGCGCAPAAANATVGGGGGGGGVTCGGGYTSGFYGGGEGPLSVFLAARRSELVAAAALGRSLGLGEAADGGRIVASDDVIRGAVAALSVGHGGLGATSRAKPIQPVHLAMLTLAAASASAALARPGQDPESGAVRAVACEAAASGAAVHASVDARKASTTDYQVVRIPGDGRCLFHAVAHGHHVRASLPQPSALAARCQFADSLRNQVADEFVKRREETEWFLEGNFDDYVANIRKPYVWGGEPELLMLSHVLKSPITVFIADPRSPRSGAIMPIAEYGREYAGDGGKEEGEEGMEGGGISSSKDAICVLYNGSSHYDALIIPRSAALEVLQLQQQARL
ncbi:hypothetical protein CLOM_g7243 [Closterium sp. NIES-68]|nr:hypothetical protein CLOM_g7243 [Closterium sp. NIES-68]GJP83262.1 hypothetical protein CLOP_g13435 [Closterium sp. NIES-67]